MTAIQEKFSQEQEKLSLQGNNPHQRLIELQAENTRLQQLVAELLIRNQQLREKTSANSNLHPME